MNDSLCDEWQYIGAVAPVDRTAILVLVLMCDAVCVVPVTMKDGKKGETVTPRVSEVADSDSRITSDHATTPR